jgi:ATP-binding cassette, subfamily B, bacterial
MRFPFTHQSNEIDCGPTCLKMIADYYGRKYDIDYLVRKCRATKTGFSLLDLCVAAKRIGFHSTGAAMNIGNLKAVVQVGPVILFWKSIHFVVLYKCTRFGRHEKFYVADPALGVVTYYQRQLQKHWMRKNEKTGQRRRRCSNLRSSKGIGNVLLLEPTDSFYAVDHEHCRVGEQTPAVKLIGRLSFFK